MNLAFGPDRFDTPAELAALMVSAIKLSRVRSCADFAVGGGGLLIAAKQRWPKARMIGVDISKKTVQTLQKSQPTWTIKCLDFIHAHPKLLHSQLADFKQSVDVIILNPPFSCRGGSTVQFRFYETDIRASTALAFFMKASQFLQKKGEIVGILPAGVFYSDRDKVALKALAAYYKVTIVSEHGKEFFHGCSVRTAIVHCRPIEKHVPQQFASLYGNTKSVKKHSGDNVELVRGWVQIHTIPKLLRESTNTVPLVHSTNLQNGAIKGIVYKGFCSSVGYICGPMVLIPRVGEPCVGKITIVNSQKQLILSDCVFAIRCNTRRDALRVKNCMRKHWDEFVQHYGGTCARHIQLSTFASLLHKWGFNVDVGRKRIPAVFAVSGRKLRLSINDQKDRPCYVH